MALKRRLKPEEELVLPDGWRIINASSSTAVLVIKKPETQKENQGNGKAKDTV